MQPLLDIVIFFARNAIPAFLLFGIVLWAGRSHRVVGALRSPSPVFVGLGGALLLGFAVVAGWYVGQPGFAGEVEPIVSSLAWLSQTGHPIYNTFEGAERYSVLYGPSVFLTNGFFLRVLGPSLASAKVASALGAVGSLVFLYAALAGFRSNRRALLVVAGAAMLYWAQGFAVYLVRPDALMVFAVGLGLYGAARLRRALAVLTVAVAAGFAVNLKVHGFLYFLPVFAVLAGRLGLRAVATAALGGAAVVAMPFVINPLVSATNYVAWLSNAAKHGLCTDFLGLILRYSVLLVLPLVILAWVRGWRATLAGPDRWLLLSIPPALIATMLLSAKPGAGMVHLLPLVPSVLFAAGRLAEGIDFRALPRRPLPQAAVTALIATVLLAGSVNGYRAVRYVDWHMSEGPDLAADIRGVMADFRHLDIAMACGGENRAFRATWLRPLLVFADHPLLLDPISVMDSALSGRELSAETYAAMSDGRIGLWLVPRSQVPFQKVNWYAPHDLIFPDEFQRHFRRCYTLRGQSRYFDLWFWNGLDGDGVRTLAGSDRVDGELLNR